MAARLRFAGRRLDQGRRFQLDIFEDGAAAAVSREVGIHGAAGPARRRVGVQAASRGLAELSHAVCDAGCFSELAEERHGPVTRSPIPRMIVGVIFVALVLSPLAIKRYQA